jgi:signal transduction histidine kinase
VRLSGLVDDLVQHAREDGPRLRRGPVDLASLVDDVADELASPAQARDLRLVREGTEQRIVVVGDEDALRQALANLAGNAVRLAPEGSRVRIGAGREPSGWSWLAVADEGPGIPADQHDLVFQRFWRGEGQQGAGGSGIGLALVRQAAEDHGGRVGLDSEVGAGSTFTMWLPPNLNDTRP